MKSVADRTPQLADLHKRIFGPAITTDDLGFNPDDRRGKEGITDDDVFRSLTDDEVLLHAATAKNGEKFLKLWRGDMSDYANDHSVADLALCSILVFWTRGHREQADRLFRQSDLMREKWNRVDYRERTFDKALSS